VQRFTILDSNLKKGYFIGRKWVGGMLMGYLVFALMVVIAAIGVLLENSILFVSAAIVAGIVAAEGFRSFIRH
jgi:hypothetical protein